MPERRELGPTPELKSEGEVRADERRRIARELHDTTSQTLVVLQLELGRLRRANIPGAAPFIDECEKAIGAIRRQIRSLDLE